MTDIVDRQTRSRMMGGIKGKNTKPELAIRRALHARGFRYRLHSKNVHGRPDLVLPKHRAVIFVHGCFWQAKFEANFARDSVVRAALLEAGWRVATIWECALRRPEKVAAAADQLSTWLLSETETLELGEREVSPPTREGEDVSSSS